MVLCDASVWFLRGQVLDSQSNTSLLVAYIKRIRFEWLGHVISMVQTRMAKKNF
jgi:hypothetical protein